MQAGIKILQAGKTQPMKVKIAPVRIRTESRKSIMISSSFDDVAA